MHFGLARRNSYAEDHDPFRYIISTCTRRREMGDIPIIAVVEGCRYVVGKFMESLELALVGSIRLTLSYRFSVPNVWYWSERPPTWVSEVMEFT